MDRRRILTGAVLGTAIVGASALGGFAPEDAFAAEPLGIEPGAPDPEFAEGLIKSIDGTTIQATGSDTTLWRVRVTDSTSVWKLKPSSFDKVEVGDGMYARGVLMDDGTIAADSVWVNIVNIKAHVVSVKGKQMRLDHKGERIIAHMVEGTSAAVYNGQSAVAEFSGIRVDSHVQVLGAWRPGTNEVDIATVYAAR